MNKYIIQNDESGKQFIIGEENDNDIFEWEGEKRKVGDVVELGKDFKWGLKAYGPPMPETEEDYQMALHDAKHELPPSPKKVAIPLSKAKEVEVTKPQKTNPYEILLREVLNYHLGNGKYNFSNLPEDQRENESFDAWMGIKSRIELLFSQSKVEEVKEKEDGWISVTKKLPETKEWVLVATDKDILTGMGSYDEHGWWICCSSHLETRITHWQPLPKPPKV